MLGDGVGTAGTKPERKKKATVSWGRGRCGESSGEAQGIGMGVRELGTYGGPTSTLGYGIVVAVCQMVWSIRTAPMVSKDASLPRA